MAGIIGGAYHMAMRNRDTESANEIVFNGLRLLAKWPTCLAAITDDESARIDEGEAIRIVARRSSDLAAATGLNTTEIAAEIVSRQITPGEWAREHGVDPTTLWPSQRADRASFGLAWLCCW